MAQIVIYYDPKSRLTAKHEHFPKDVAVASIEVETMPDDPDEVKALSEKLAGLLFDQLTR